MCSSIFAQSPHGEALKINCNQCHTTSGWEIDIYVMRFDHNKTTDYNLEGAHSQTDCIACHETLVFNEAPNQCASCHNDIHSATVGNDCVRCHTSNTWLVDAIPEIHEENGFPLIGSHSGLSCIDCHTADTNLRFDNIGNECINCHREDYLTTNSPNHNGVGFSTDCLECHSPIGTGWTPAVIGNHDFFPLTLGHDIQDCTQCHLTDDYSDIDSNCVSCHQDTYDATTNPNHNNVGFPTDCVQCHTTNPGWTPATIEHDFFPLTLGHDIQDCAQCHFTTNYSDADSDCVSCHQSDYSGATNPNHSSAQFPTDCVECHTTNPGWTPSTFNHDGQYFPIYSGKHQGEWNQCIDCHTNPNDYSLFSCIDCHEHDNQNEVNNDHSEVNGYVYESNACLECHPDGND